MSHTVSVTSATTPGDACPLCGAPAPSYLFARPDVSLARCSKCGLTRLDRPAASPVAPGADRSTPSGGPRWPDIDRRTADAALRALARRHASREAVLAVIADGHPFLTAVASAGLAVTARVDPHQVDRPGAPDGPFAAAIVVFELENADDPVAALREIHAALAPGGILLVVTPSFDGPPDRVLRSRAPAWLRRARYGFDAQTIQSVILRAGFDGVEWSSEPDLVVTARRSSIPARPVLSIVMPVFNERATFARTLEAVLNKPCPGLDKEIVIVESGSTDGTRELVRQYEHHPGVRVVLEDRPRGKGAAVRNGFRHASGSIILIQDADDEYDVNDYDALLEPVRTFQRAFVLGSRHLGTWKMRAFADQPGVSAFFNVGHILFSAALNTIYRQHINDPFTMYKVFRRDCLHRLKLECNRFDFDFELVIKLLRKGYVPLEVPVNYRSRSFKEGKKISTLRDPFTWIRALIKYRFASIEGD